MSNGDKKRAQAKQVVREQLARERRRKVTLWTTVGVVTVLVMAGLIGWGVAAGQEKANAGKLTVPPAAVDDGTAFARGTGPVQIDIYEDFLCPFCRKVETAIGPTVTQLVDAGKVTVRYHPIAILDHLSSTQYSTRAAGASAAAAQGGKFFEYHEALFAQQPPEGGAGLDDAKLIEIGRSVGLTDQAFADAITGKTYTAWATKVTDTASSRGITGTPSVLVAGTKLDSPTPQALAAAVEAASA
ncbi:DsbA family protein [Couchioplanes caeruleus]|uniref:Disulfide bond formation protein DsbA n=2 Tax=Couchioplanes caeruleus TaxID=56438 RepID=A0A1K0FES1_9ACTN|nr:thioredoxin domain-containing protein [Couchioplanes caeruleus]OJF11325.1 disulfide bond formation protein DsbA [Couchioplanes caeruleus subsp. caeruleus]ROP29877.1 protein-disulfide isomerase [Couchioplanes caeruleus]